MKSFNPHIITNFEFAMKEARELSKDSNLPVSVTFTPNGWLILPGIPITVSETNVACPDCDNVYNLSRDSTFVKDHPMIKDMTMNNLNIWINNYADHKD